jgi:hypothetical protein
LDQRARGESQTQFHDEQGEAEDWLRALNGLFQLFERIRALPDGRSLGPDALATIPDGTLRGSERHVLSWCDRLSSARAAARALRARGPAESSALRFHGDVPLLDFVSWNPPVPSSRAYGPLFPRRRAFLPRLPTPTAASRTHREPEPAAGA